MTLKKLINMNTWKKKGETKNRHLFEKKEQPWTGRTPESQADSDRLGRQGPAGLLRVAGCARRAPQAARIGALVLVPREREGEGRQNS